VTSKYWFNTKTGQVEHGRQSLWSHLLGPYDTAEEAARALETARHRTETWDDDDERWRDPGDHGDAS
jgi:hypothetical protein